MADGSVILVEMFGPYLTNYVHGAHSNSRPTGSYCSCISHNLVKQ